MSGYPRPDASVRWALGAVGACSLAAFLTVFVNIPWEWNMFMDDVAYNSWMPGVGDIGAALTKEIRSYWELGRFYPVKYLANLLKWRYLPNDPYVFRCFNLAVYLLSVSLASVATILASRPSGGDRRLSGSLPLFLYLAGSSFLHKPLLETISLNPLGETWVCLFFACGSLCLFQSGPVARYALSRAFFLLVALSKEPAALVFLASSARYGLMARADKDARLKWTAQAVIDFLLFAFFLGLALTAMAHGSLTKGAYFATTPWLRYSYDFLYKLARYAVWTSPFVAAFALSWRRLAAPSARFAGGSGGAAVFFGVFGLGYLVFMSSQGIVAYQDAPAAMAFFSLFSLATAVLWHAGALEGLFSRWGGVLLLLFALSYLVSVSRWERFVRGIVEPWPALVGLVKAGGEMTILVPRGEVSGHVERLLGQHSPGSRVFEVDEHVLEKAALFRGKVFLVEFPVYMGDLPGEQKKGLEQTMGGWASTEARQTYRIYRAQKTF